MKKKLLMILVLIVLMASAAPASAAAEEANASGMATETYACAEFTVSIPKEWKVEYETIDAGDGITRIIVCIKDPEHSKNRIFYTTAMEPFFVSTSAKNALLPYLPEAFDWAPVLDGDPSAEAVLRLWPNCYTTMQAQGLGYETYLGDYVLDEVIATEPDSGNGVTGVHAKVTIGGGDALYDMYFENQLVLTNPPSGAPRKAKYYISYNNMGIVVAQENYEGWIDTLIQCASSFVFNDPQYARQ